ncbi:MAG: hypothetical protein Q8J68_09485 [Methanolobus sp.]|uniref:hypothetical protein n=1 Tax=Methanolobus sp. TaxID=1874737 RepID=UPI00272F364F|nr:hypothetical protein [Methanolobus sp.]MDP2217504.1 hypothetical protein [Methanolobus sp.]
MIEGEVEILLVEDNPNDSELALRALKKNKIANNVVVVTDGEQALDFSLRGGSFPGVMLPIYRKWSFWT